ncbi:CRTAC1 family protein [Pseudoalteromonas sp. SWXJ133]|uniref:CRTAC1 family protein n=1 Tax=unclassified Pseudoalteromonas TaxID=194690 RepID=UPI00140BA819|nr:MULTISPECIES: CRTAC1 family protein [unclassified Pseudoalteromonas]MBH0020820.1 CRTAC1 family protein [Pseudoalteromonas sp. SWXJ133]
MKKNSKPANTLFCLSLIATSVLLYGCNTTQRASNETLSDNSSNKLMFSESHNIIPFEPLSRRKWDSALIADFDKDGYQDVLITEHTHAVKIFWNNKNNTFSAPQIIIKGDTHGVAVADYDLDGRMDLIIAQGGGGGLKPRLPVSFQINHDRTVEGGETFDDFERTRGRAVKLIDGNNSGTLDLMLSAFPLKKQKKGANHIYKNEGHNQFKFVDYLPTAKWLGYKALVSDFDNDGHDDLFFYGGDDIVAAQSKSDLGYKNKSKAVLGNNRNISHVSSMTEIDFDNDGDFDLFLTRAKHQFEQHTFYDAQSQNFAFFTRNEAFKFEDFKIEGNFEIENLQMAYPHFNVFIGKNSAPLTLEGHGGSERTVQVTKEQAAGWPKKLHKKGLYIGYLGNDTWRVAGDTKSPTAGVIKRVTNSPKVKGLEPLPAVLLENQQGKFVDATAKLNINLSEPTTSAVAGDFNNDGWSDLFVLRYGNPAKANEQLLYLNQQGKGFETLQDHGVISTELGATGGSAQAFDYDNDGDLDLIYSNERGRWHLFTNNTALNAQHNFLVTNIGYSLNAGVSALGATATIKACGQTYKRVVGATGAGFSQSENSKLHVGLGTCTKINNVSVRWSNNEHVDISNAVINDANGQLVGRKEPL